MKIFNYFKTLFGVKSKRQKGCCNDGICECKKTKEFDLLSANTIPVLDLPKEEPAEELQKEENALQETPKKKVAHRKTNKKKGSTKEKIEESKKDSTSSKPKKRNYKKRKPKSDSNTQINQN
jgi:hypothetical protein